MKLVAFCFVSICSLISVSAHGLSAEKKISQFAIDKWRTSDGLPEMAVQAMTQTADGYLWIGTQEGLARFDGRRFVVFNHANTPALRADLVFALAEDKSGCLWIGTVDGPGGDLGDSGSGADGGINPVRAANVSARSTRWSAAAARRSSAGSGTGPRCRCGPGRRNRGSCRRAP